jgi:hypothetical protein
LQFEQDPKTGYGCIPNLDSNASLQLKVDYAATTVAFSGGTATAATISMRTTQHYWAPVGKTLAGAPVEVAPPGAGDYLETRYETQTVSAQSENLVTVTNRGGLIKGILLVSRAAGTVPLSLPHRMWVRCLITSPLTSRCRWKSSTTTFVVRVGISVPT